MSERIYNGRTLAGWDVDPDAVICPLEPDQRLKWGWKQDEKGAWYRDLEEGQNISDPLKSNL